MSYKVELYCLNKGKDCPVSQVCSWRIFHGTSRLLMPKFFLNAGYQHWKYKKEHKLLVSLRLWKPILKPYMNIWLNMFTQVLKVEITSGCFTILHSLKIVVAQKWWSMLLNLKLTSDYWKNLKQLHQVGEFLFLLFIAVFIILLSECRRDYAYLVYTLQVIFFSISISEERK